MPSRSCVRTAIVCVVGLLAIGGCGDSGTELPGTSDFSVILRNTAPSGGPVSVLGPDEQTGTLGSALAPGAQRGYLVDGEQCVTVTNVCSVGFSAINAAGANVGSVVCSYTLGIRPSNAEVHWTGTALICAGGWTSCPLPTLDKAAPSLLGLALQCAAPAATWRLDGITGNASGSWSDISGTGTATLTFSVPLEVTASGTYPVSATLSGSFTALPEWSGINKNISVSICDRNTEQIPPLCGADAAASLMLERAVLMASGTVTFTAAWTLSSVARQSTTFSIEAAGGMSLPGTPLKLIATYTRVN